jgi:soluble lytic murein transglycosylase-like protein
VLRGLLLALALLPAFARAADIYVRISPDGTPYFSDRAGDPGFALYLRDPAAKQAPGTLTGAPTGPNPGAYRHLVERAAAREGLDPALVHAVILVESRYDPVSRSPKGARGLMQLMPATARRFGVRDITDPAQNIDAGTRYLRLLLDRFGRVELALAAYNAGEEAVERHGRVIPPYSETLAYVPRVLSLYNRTSKGPT